MSREDPQFKLRMTEELRDQIAEAARANNRSMNAEIIGRLEESFASKSLDQATLKDVIDETVRRSIEAASEFLRSTQVEHVQPKSEIAGGTTNLVIMSELEHELMALDETSHKLLSHANAIALVHGEEHDAYQRVMKDAATVRKLQAGLRETLDIIAQTARPKGASPNRKAKS
ncbi:Arc family DNA-binding protein [Stenotrophomonas sp. 278]|uniref:Arc family DNA-binding protein n=1 Tax=Stenotrophomonas sp. 278 TaxID=2479851 RepID=UPI000F68EB05|nr:Arc family DNA-binding protein [Stenotrophomonas sp. 278]